MIRKFREIHNEKQLSTCHHHNNAYKMSTTTALKSQPAANLAPSFGTCGCCCRRSGIGSKTNTTAVAAMSSLAEDLCKATTTKQTTPPMEAAVVINSIIYSKPSFCSIVVDLGGKEGTASVSASDKMAMARNTPAPSSFTKMPGIAGFLPQNNQTDAEVYMMSTTMNGAIHHQISALCDNFLAMLGIVANSERNNVVESPCDDDDDDDGIVFLPADADYNPHAVIYDEDDDDDDEDDDDYDDDDEDDDDDDGIVFLPADTDYNSHTVYDDDEDDEDDDGIVFLPADADYNPQAVIYDDDDEDDDDDFDFKEDDDSDDNEEYKTDVEHDNNDCLYEGYDVVDFSKCPAITKTPAFICDKKKKKVRFNTKPIVHVMHAWNYAYRAARKGEWEMYARDRDRFKMRIQRTGLTLNPILDPEHRLRIYEQRFANLYEEKEKEKPKEKHQSKKSKQNRHNKRRRRRRRPNF